MKTSFTPGPWFVGNPKRNGSPPDEIHCKEFDQDGESFLCETGGNYANARLIAAAPMLFEALQAMMRWSDCTDIPNEVQKMCHEAINQATGQEP